LSVLSMAPASHCARLWVGITTEIARRCFPTATPRQLQRRRTTWQPAKSTYTNAILHATYKHDGPLGVAAVALAGAAQRPKYIIITGSKIVSLAEHGAPPGRIRNASWAGSSAPSAGRSSTCPILHRVIFDRYSAGRGLVDVRFVPKAVVSVGRQQFLYEALVKSIMTSTGAR